MTQLQKIKPILIQVFVSESVKTAFFHVPVFFPSIYLFLTQATTDQHSNLRMLLLSVLLCLLSYYLSFRISYRKSFVDSTPKIIKTDLILQDGVKWNKITMSDGEQYLEGICYCDKHKFPYLNENGDCFCPHKDCLKSIKYDDVKLLHRAASSILLKKHISS